MTKEQYEGAKEFARRLTEKRLVMADGQLLDQCQAHLDTLLAHIELDFEEHPQDVGEHIEEEDLPSGMFEAREPPPIPPQLHREPGPPPPPVHSEPSEEVRHTGFEHKPAHKAVEHKRPSPRKTRR